MAQNSAAIAERMQEVKGELAERCAQDSTFREGLLSDPNGAIEAEYELAPGSLSEITMKVIVEEPGSLVVPIPPDLSELELTDEQLDQVSGGAAFISATAAVGGVIAGVGAVGAAAVGAGVIVQRTRAGRRW